MNELIKVTETEDGKQSVSARELYTFLEVSEKFTDWSKRMFEYGFDEEKDFIRIIGKSNGGRPSIDYALTIDTAKEISMIQRTEKGKQARKYFIECEKIAKELLEINPPKRLPQTYSEALRELADVTEEKQLLLESNAKLQFRSDFVDVCFDADGVFDFSEVAKILKLGYGSITLYKKMRDAGLIMHNDTIPYQKYINNGYFKVVEKLIENGSFKKLITTTFATQKGIGYIHKLLTKKSIAIRD